MNTQSILSVIGLGIFGAAVYRVWRYDTSTTKLVDETEGEYKLLPVIHTEEFVKQIDHSLIDSNVTNIPNNIIFTSSDSLDAKLSLIQEKQKQIVDYTASLIHNTLANEKNIVLTYNNSRPATSVFSIFGTQLPCASYINS